MSSQENEQKRKIPFLESRIPDCAACVYSTGILIIRKTGKMEAPIKITPLRKSKAARKPILTCIFIHQKKLIF